MPSHTQGAEALVKIIQKINSIREEARTTAQLYEQPEIQAIKNDVDRYYEIYRKAWSGSWLGYHSRVYIENFEPRNPGDRFDANWGFRRMISNGTRGRWVEYSEDDVKARFREQTGFYPGGPLHTLTASVERVFGQLKNDALGILNFLLSVSDDIDHALKVDRDEVRELDARNLPRKIIEIMRPSQTMTRDAVAIQEGFVPPPHIQLYADFLSLMLPAHNLGILEQSIGRTKSYLDYKIRVSSVQADEIRAIMSSKSKERAGEGSMLAGRDITVISNLSNSTIANASGKSARIQLQGGNTDTVDQAKFNKDVLDVLGLLTDSKEEIEEDFSTLRDLFASLLGLGIEDGMTVSDVRELVAKQLSNKDLSTLSRILSSGRSIVEGIASNAIFSEYIVPLLS